MKDYGDIVYDNDFNRFLFFAKDKVYALHCGDSLNIFFLNRYRTCRIELDRDNNWYVIFKDCSFILRKNITYKVCL